MTYYTSITLHDIIIDITLAILSVVHFVVCTHTVELLASLLVATMCHSIGLFYAYHFHYAVSSW